MGVTALTVGLWCAFQGVDNIFGQLGVIALIPVLLLFGCGVLNVGMFRRLRTCCV